MREQPTKPTLDEQSLAAQAGWQLWALAAGVVAVFGRIAVQPSEFFQDDFIFLLQNTASLLGAWTTDSYSAAGYEGAPAVVYRPLGVLYFRLLGLVFDLADPRPFHAISVLIHVANSLLLLVFLRRLRIQWAALLAAVWAVSPLHGETVGWISAQFDLLSASCVLGALLLAQRRPELSIAALLAGVCIKETSLAALPAWAVLAYTHNGRVRGGRALGGVVLGLAGWSGLRAAAGVKSDLLFPDVSGLLKSSGGEVLRLFGLGDVLTTPWPADGSGLTPLVAALGALLVAAIALWQRRELLPLVLLMAVLAPGMLFGQTQVGPIADPDRYAYLATTGIPVLAAVAFSGLFTLFIPATPQPKMLLSLQAGVLLMCGVLAFLACREVRFHKSDSDHLHRHESLGRQSDYLSFYLGRDTLLNGKPCAAAPYFRDCAARAINPARASECVARAKGAEASCSAESVQP